MSQFLANSQKVETKSIFRINRRQSNTGDTVGIKHSKLEARSPGQTKIRIIEKNRLRRAVSEIKLKRTDTTLDLSLLDY
ncbi:hypothetical protein L873DRAFT_1811467, partial [Choiromyces venosus 120613-1]